MNALLKQRAVSGAGGVGRLANAARRTPDGGWQHAAFSWSYAPTAAVGCGQDRKQCFTDGELSKLHVALPSMLSCRLSYTL